MTWLKANHLGRNTSPRSIRNEMNGSSKSPAATSYESQTISMRFASLFMRVERLQSVEIPCASCVRSIVTGCWGSKVDYALSAVSELNQVTHGILTISHPLLSQHPGSSTMPEPLKIESSINNVTRPRDPKDSLDNNCI